jgi:Zn-dependent protease with chaperone function
MLCLAFILAGLAARDCSAQSAASQPAPATTAPPAQLAGAQAYSLPPGKLAQAITLNRIRLILGIVSSLLEIVLYWLLLASGAAAGLGAWTQRVFRRRKMQGLLFFAILIVLVDLASLPLGLYGHHISLSNGISVQSWGGWFTDRAKALGIAVAATPVLLLFNWIVRVSPRRYWVWIWMVSLLLILMTALGEPLLIDPLFNKFEPLVATHPALVERLETVVARTGTQIAPDRIFLMKASEKSNGLNAYVTGIGGSKRFVIWDTAADRLPDDEVLFIFGHESGHYVLNHIPKGLAFSAIGIFFLFWGCAAVASWLARRFGARWRLVDALGAPSFAYCAEGGNDEANHSEAGANPLASRQGFLVLLLTLSVASFLLQPTSSAFSRHFEHEADIYGQEAIHGLVADPQKTAVSAFNHMGEAWLEDPNPNPFIEFWSYSHPSVQHRAEFARHYDPWANGGRGRFFAR